MKLVICLDDNKGMLFNNRRQSRDKAVVEDIISSCNSLYITPFSQKLFADYISRVTVAENVSDLDKDDTLFLENINPAELENVNQITVYNWNRVYPADLHCTVDFSLYSLVSETQLAGNSHPKIIKQVFVRGL